MKKLKLILLIVTTLIITACVSSKEYHEQLKRFEEANLLKRDLSTMTAKEGAIAMSVRIKTTDKPVQVTTECDTPDGTIYGGFRCGPYSFAIIKILSPAEEKEAREAVKKVNGGFVTGLVAAMGGTFGEGITEYFKSDVDHPVVQKLSSGKYKIVAAGWERGKDKRRYSFEKSNTEFEIKAGEVSYIGHWILDVNSSYFTFDVVIENRMAAAKADLESKYKKTFTVVNRTQ
jgi:hypothetical protein